MLDDGETIVFGNCAMMVGLEAFRAGRALVYLDGKAFVSIARLTGFREVEIVERHLVTGLTATLGCDVLRRSVGTFPAGTVFMQEGGSPITSDGVTVNAGSRGRTIAFSPETGEVLGSLPLGDGSSIARRYNALDQPNGLAVAPDGTVYVGDIPNSNPDPDPASPPPVPPAIYRVPGHLLDAMSGGEDIGDHIDRILMPGYVNGLTCSPVDGCLWAVSCSPIDPAEGGVYRITDADFAAQTQPAPMWKGLGILDGITITRRGTVIVSNPLTSVITAFASSGEQLEIAPATEVSMPADINVCYPHILAGEPALLTPEISVGRPPDTGRVLVLGLAGL